VPTYQYRCKDCGQDLEVVQSFTDDSLTIHEACGGRLRKVFGNVGIAFKGDGFYKNDSRGKTSTTTATKDKTSGESSTSNGDKGSSSSTDTASSPKTDTSTAAGSSSSGKGDTATAGSKSA
jgi:putative FmdB family regulatory protein